MAFSARTKLFAILTGSGVGLGIAVAAITPTKSVTTTPDDPNLAALMGSRSPGVRGGAAVSSKAVRMARNDYSPTFAPSSRVLSDRVPMVASAPVPAAVVASNPIAAAAIAPLPSAAVPVATAGLAAPVAAAPTVAAVGGGGFPLIGAAAALPLIPAIFGGGGGGGGGVTSLSLAPAVPEPATWLMMIVGFGVIGWALRRQRRRAARAPARFAGAAMAAAA